MDARLDQNQPELGVRVAAELVQVLAHGDGLLDEAVEILRDVGGETCTATKGARGEIISSQGRTTDDTYSLSAVAPCGESGDGVRYNIAITLPWIYAELGVNYSRKQ